MPITSDLDIFRLELGDTDMGAPLLSDEECQYFIDRRPGNVLLAVADACDSLARRFAREFDFRSDNQSFSASQKAKAYRDLAADLRARASGLTTTSTTRVDGYSQDIGNQDVFEVDVNPRRRFYGDRDITGLP